MVHLQLQGCHDCTACAIVQRVEVGEKEGMPVVNTLMEVATPDHHAMLAG